MASVNILTFFYLSVKKAYPPKYNLIFQINIIISYTSPLANQKSCPII